MRTLSLRPQSIGLPLIVVLSGAVGGCASYEAPPPSPPMVYVQPAPITTASVEYASGDLAVQVSSESDFYEPLAPYGEWVVIGSYGRCWRPRNVAVGWRPYTEGHWEWTDAGWYWVSEEPWGWATCHYGRWDVDAGGSWFWVPHTEWAPAWVEWREGSGYVGWAPEPPRYREGHRPRADRFVFVQENRISERVSPTTVIVNNTTIINRTTVINNTRVVNRTTINAGPSAQTIERATGRRFAPAPVHQVREREVARVPANLRPRAASAPGAVTTTRRPEAAPRAEHREPGRPAPAATSTAPIAVPRHEEVRPHQEPAAEPRSVSPPHPTEYAQTTRPAPEVRREPAPVETHPQQPVPVREETRRPPEARAPAAANPSAENHANHANPPHPPAVRKPKAPPKVQNEHAAEKEKEREEKARDEHSQQP